jgi:hypothetical protein
VYRDRIPTPSRAIERRRPHMESLFRTLRRAGIPRRGLYLAWDFTVATPRTLASRLLSIRDRAFAGLGDRDLDDLRVAGRAPPFAITQVDDGDPTVRRIDGTFRVPCFLDRPGCPPGARFRRELNLPGAQDRHADGPRPTARLRPRALRERRRGAAAEAAGAAPRILRLRHRLGRHVGPRPPQRGAALRRPVPLPEPGRPQSAGLSRLHVPGPADAASARLRLEPRLRRRHRQAPAFLRGRPARAGSSGVPSPRWPRTSRARRSWFRA